MSPEDEFGLVEVWTKGGPWPPIVLSVVIGVVCLGVGLFLMRTGTRFSSNPLILCSVTGLLIGLALLVVLPQAVERLMQRFSPEKVFLIFLSAPVLMFILEHIVLDHEHVHPLADGTSVTCTDANCEGCGPGEAPPPKTGRPGEGWGRAPASARRKKDTERTALLGKASVAPAAPSPATRNSAPAAPASSLAPVRDETAVVASAEAEPPPEPPPPPPPRRCRALCASCRRPKCLIFVIEKWMLLLRLGAWLLHSLFDGIILGSSDLRPSVQLPLAFAILVCAVQDIAGMYIYFTSRNADRFILTAGVIGFATAFPVGAGISAAALYGRKQSELIDVMRVCMAGLFVYMALFEMAPPHAHGRVQNLKYVLAFCFGLGSAYLADAFEEAMHPHRQQEDEAGGPLLAAQHAARALLHRLT